VTTDLAPARRARGGDAARDVHALWAALYLGFIPTHSDAGECKPALELMSRAFAEVPLANLRRVKLEGAAAKVKNRCSLTP
jgi:hypothetical protein